jgi:hypothetical protein
LEQVVRVLKRTVAAIEAEIETGHQAEAAQ